MLSFPRTKLVKISTPYTRGGVLFDDFQRGFGHENEDLLVWKATSALMNPTITEARLERERRLDPLRFAREYLAEFTDDLSACFEFAALQACVDSGVRERLAAPAIRYAAFCDAASGEKKGNDKFTVAIAHQEHGRVILDRVRAWPPPFSPATVIEEIAALAKQYRLTTIAGDRYAPGFVAERFQKHGIRYEPSPMDRSALYLELLNLVNSGQGVLLDLPDLLRELRGLERRSGPNGRDRVDHAPGAHDDVANAAAGALVRATRRARRLSPDLMKRIFREGNVTPTEPDPLWAGLRNRF